MRTPRLYLPQTLVCGREVTLPRDRAHYLQRVLRLQPGAALLLFDGHGGHYDAVLGDAARAVVGEHHAIERESPLDITLLQGISRGERMEQTLRKATELGVSAIQPITSARCEVRLQGERLRKRLQHWQGIVASACEQCGRNRVPTVSTPTKLDSALQSATGALGLMLDPTGTTTLTGLAPPPGPVALLVGPEGGLSPNEISQAASSGFHGVRLGPRILRTETAPLAALATMQLLWGDI